MLVADPKIQAVPQTAWHLQKIKIQNTSCAHLVILAWKPVAANTDAESLLSYLLCFHTCNQTLS